MTHGERIQSNDGKLSNPPLPGAAHLLRHFEGAGRALYGGMGAAPLTHGELRAYQRNSGVTLNPWEVATLRRMSEAWCAELQRADDPAATPPYIESLDETYSRDTVSRRIKSALGSTGGGSA